MQVIFFCIRQDVEARLTEICVLSSVVNSMIVIPQCTGILSIGVVVVLVLARLCGIICPAIKWSPAVRAVQVDTVRQTTCVSMSTQAEQVIARYLPLLMNRTTLSVPCRMRNVGPGTSPLYPTSLVLPRLGYICTSTGLISIS